ncbi:hypothetical protein AGMMS50229_03850 [Campylobacterota bacterium]|nr:hypothetical protein AGMMS50229_03850 [Campylobacterota bacterium]
MENERKLIMLVDDNPTNLINGVQVLSEKYSVFTAPSAKKMFALLEKHRPDLLLLDIEMPEMNGYEAIKLLKESEEFREIPVIFLTAKSEASNELDGLSMGAIDYITKPFVPALLIKRLDIHLLIESQKRALEEQQKALEYYNANLRKAFSTYVSDEVIDEVMSDPSRLQLGGSMRNVTAVFTDIRSFTPIAETLDPRDLVKLLNIYLSGISNVILDHKGTIDKYVGDAVIGFFGAPLALSNHALSACTAAIEMRLKESEINETLHEKGLSNIRLFTRIGINSGNMIVGNMGSEQKMNYTIMGNEVNLASRLEGVNKYYGTQILTTEATLAAAGEGLLVRRLDRVRVVGFSASARIYELINTAAAATPKERELVERFDEALIVFENRDYQAAAAAFEAILAFAAEDKPAALFLERSREFLRTPPATDWDGVFAMHEK